jgi:cytochrome c-type biogenesis protein CcmH
LMSADSWADYADAQASLAGRLDGEPEKAIARALQLDPQHPKALWLKASLAHEQHRYKEALATWRLLLAVVPPGSSDARIVAANIAEATRLATG